MHHVYVTQTSSFRLRRGHRRSSSNRNGSLCSRRIEDTTLRLKSALPVCTAVGPWLSRVGNANEPERN
jgi:hypothetical protein